MNIVVVFVEVIFPVALVLIFVTQILVPIVRGTRLFPMLSIGRIEREIAESKSAGDVQEMEKESKEVRDQVSKDKEPKEG